MSLVAEEPLMFRVGVANSEFFRELSVCDEMLPICAVPGVNRGDGIAGPFATRIYSASGNATGTNQIRSANGARHFDNRKQAKRDESFHLSPRKLPGPQTSMKFRTNRN